MNKNDILNELKRIEEERTYQNSVIEKLEELIELGDDLQEVEIQIGGVEFYAKVNLNNIHGEITYKIKQLDSEYVENLEHLCQLEGGEFNAN